MKMWMSTMIGCRPARRPRASPQEEADVSIERQCEDTLRQSVTDAELDFDRVVKRSGKDLPGLVAWLSADGFVKMHDKVDEFIMQILDGGASDGEDGAPAEPAMSDPGAPLMASSQAPPTADSLASLAAELASGPAVADLGAPEAGEWDSASFAGSLDGMRDAMRSSMGPPRRARPFGSKATANDST